jgi:hypothetical protein
MLAELDRSDPLPLHNRVAAASEAEALFKEANQRRRRRWLLIGTVVTVVTAATLVASVALMGAAPSHRSAGSPTTAPTAAAPVTGHTPLVAWVDYDGALHIGTVHGLSQRVVAATSADPTTPVVWLGTDVFWVNERPPGLLGSTVEGFDTATGRAIRVGRGLQIFPSLNRSFLYVQRNARHLAEYSPTTASIGHIMSLPKGWTLASPFLLNDPTPAVANGILVESSQAPGAAPTPTLGVWNPTSGRVRTIAKIWKIVGTSTGPDGRSSMIAWLPAVCVHSPTNCRLALTDSSTLTTRFVPSPSRQGFEFGGGFSPNGALLAVFINLSEQQEGSLPTYQQLSPVTQLALVNTKSGSLRVVHGTVINVGDALAWAQWLDNDRLLAGAVESPDGLPNDNHYLVDANDGQAQPFSFFPGGGQADGTFDVNFSAAVQPSR